MSFKEIIGQESAVSFLKLAHQYNRLAHAYIFFGPPGVGKKKAALNFSKLLFCQNPKNEEPCDQCSFCLKVNNLNHPDVQLVSPEGQFIKIDAIREACRRLSLIGFESKRKILLIFDAQFLNEESSNALLKTLEEPTPHTVIILVAYSLRSILPTIASRCQRIIFRSLSQEAIHSILKKESGISSDEAIYLASLSQGSLGKAYGYLKEGLFTRKNKIIENILDEHVPLESIIEWSMKDRLARNEKIKEALCVLSSWFRDLLLAKVTDGPKDFINLDRKDDIIKHSGFFSFMEIEERMAAIAEAAKDLGYNLNARILLTNLRVTLWK